MTALENKATTDNNMIESHHPHAPTSSRAAQIKSFVWHLLQMILAMQAGMTLYMLFADRLAPAGYKAATVAYPLFDFWMMMIAMTVPMILLMWYHKYDWRYCIGMTLAMLAPVALLTVLTQVDLMSICALHCNGQTAMVLGMAAFMLYRRH
jgi:hypothetical protein